MEDHELVRFVGKLVVEDERVPDPAGGERGVLLGEHGRALGHPLHPVGDARVVPTERRGYQSFLITCAAMLVARSSSVTLPEAEPWPQPLDQERAQLEVHLDQPAQPRPWKYCSAIASFRKSSSGKQTFRTSDTPDLVTGTT